MFVVILANNFDPFYEWDIGIECSNDCVVLKCCVFNETNKVSSVFNACVYHSFLVT